MDDIRSLATYKLESIQTNFNNQKRVLEQKIKDAYDEKIKRMYQSQLTTATEKFHAHEQKILTSSQQADIHTKLIVHGIIQIKEV